MPTRMDTTEPATAATVRQASPELPTRNQRPRVDFTVNTSSKLPPLKTAVLHIEDHVASLHDGLSDLLMLKGKEITSLRHRLFLKESIINKMESHADRIPVSARVDFKLSCLNGLEENPDFLVLHSKNAGLVEKFRKDLKADIIACGQLEITFLKKAIATHFAKSLSLVVAMFHIAQRVDQAKTHPTALKMIADHSATLLKHVDDDDFETTYISVNNVTGLTAIARLNVNDRSADIHRAIESVFTSSWDLYLKTSRDQELALDLKVHMKEHVLMDKTEDAVNIVDQELPATREQLHELIQKEIDRANKKRANQTAAKAAKNKQRGPNKPGASERNQKKSGKSKNQSDKAAASAKGGRQGNDKKSRGRSRDKSRSKSSTKTNAERRKKRGS